MRYFEETDYRGLDQFFSKKDPVIWRLSKVVVKDSSLSSSG